MNKEKTNQGMRLVTYSLAFLLALALASMVTAGTAWAGGLPSINALKGTVNATCYKGSMMTYDGAKGSIKQAKSSNTKVATVKVLKNMQGGNNLLVTKKNPGKTKITYKYKGKTYTARLVVKKYKNPVKSFAIGNKEIASSFKKSPSAYAIPWEDQAGVVKIKATSGWKVSGIYVFNYSTDKMKNVKNGYKLKKSEHVESVMMKNKAKGLSEMLILN